MNVNNVSITISAVSTKQYPSDEKNDIAFVGRSNVGKSSLINKLVNRKSMARISAKPGKTATINFYNVEDKLYFVDLPGYGFAQVSKGEKEKWGRMIEEYLNKREQLVNVVLLVDSRHKPTGDDIIMVDWIRHIKPYVIIAATKCDKLSKKQRTDNLEIIKQTLKLTANDVIIPFSAETGEGKDKLWTVIENNLDLNKD